MILGAAYGSVSDIEIFWTLIATLGLCFSFYTIREASGDWLTIRDSGIGNGRKLLARSTLLSEWGRAVVQSIFLVIGVLAMFTPEAPNASEGPWYVVAIRVLITWGLISSSILISGNTALSFYTRRQLQRIVREGLEREVALKDDVSEIERAAVKQAVEVTRGAAEAVLVDVNEREKRLNGDEEGKEVSPGRSARERYSSDTTQTAAD